MLIYLSWLITGWIYMMWVLLILPTRHIYWIIFSNPLIHHSPSLCSAFLKYKIYKLNINTSERAVSWEIRDTVFEVKWRKSQLRFVEKELKGQRLAAQIYLSQVQRRGEQMPQGWVIPMLIWWAPLGKSAPYRIGHLWLFNSYQDKSKTLAGISFSPKSFCPPSIPLLGSFLPSLRLSEHGKGAHLTLHPGFKEVLRVVPAYSKPVLNLLFSHIVSLCLYSNSVG